MGDAWRDYLLNVAREIDDFDEGINLRRERKMLRDATNPFDMSENDFIGLFRLSRGVARRLCDDLRGTLRRLKQNGLPTELKSLQFRQVSSYIARVMASRHRRYNAGFPLFTLAATEPTPAASLALSLAVLAALRFYAAGSYQSSVGQNFLTCMSQSSVSRCVHQVSSAINEVLLPQWIKFPLAPRDVANNQVKFMDKYQFPGVLGTIDCTHVAIVPPPAEDPDFPEHLFVNRKNYHSINVKLICDAECKIININANYGGGTHDAFIWANSRAQIELQAMHERYGHSSWLLGDSGYPLQPWLLTPIIGAEPGTPECLYTTRHATTRNCVERCNGILKSRFRCLRKDRVLHYRPAKAALIINACAVLHNIAIAAGLPVPEDAHEPAGPDEALVVAELPHDQHILREGRRIRNMLIHRHFT